MRPLLVLVSCALLTGSASADVFVRAKLPRDGSEFEVLLRARHAYAAPANVNGSDAQLRVSTTTMTLEAVLRQCRETFGEAGVFSGGKSMVRGVVMRDDRVTRLLALRGEGGTGTTIFALNQSEAEYRRSRHAPARDLLTEVPAYPGSVPEFYMKDQHTRQALAVSSTTHAPRSVLDTLADAMASDGWKPLVGFGRTHGVLLFERGRKLCTIQVTPGADGRGASITRLHKEAGLE